MSEKTRALHLLRHAKSSWREPDLDDHDRPLSGRGRRDGEAMAQRLAEDRLAPDLVLCSTALRTRQTLDFVMRALQPGRVALERELYDAPMARLLARLRELDDDCGTVLLIGHNPGLQELALSLAASTAPTSMRVKFPTAAVASFRVTSSWRELGNRRAELVGFLTPRALGAAAAS